MAVKKSELIKILVEDYGYEKEDLKFDAEGKPYTNAKLQALIDAEIADAEEAEVDKYRVVAKEQKISDTDKIQVMSGTIGTVVYRSEISRRVWKFTQFGQMEKMPYEELVAIQNRYNGYFTQGWIIVLDKRVQEEFGLTGLYNNILTPQNIEEVFKKPVDEVESIINGLSDGMKITFCRKAQELYAQNKIESHRVIQLIEQKFGFSLEDNSPIADIAETREIDSKGIIYIDKE